MFVGNFSQQKFQCNPWQASLTTEHKLVENFGFTNPQLLQEVRGLTMLNQSFSNFKVPRTGTNFCTTPLLPRHEPLLGIFFAPPMMDLITSRQRLLPCKPRGNTFVDDCSCLKIQIWKSSSKYPERFSGRNLLSCI